MGCTNETCQQLLNAAVALLEARSNQMMTAVEWDALRHAVTSCGGSDPTTDDHEN